MLVFFFFHYKSYNTLICVISIDLHIFLLNYKPKEASYENLEVKVQASHDPNPHQNLYSAPKVKRLRCVKYLNFEKFVLRNLTSLATCMVHLHSRNVNFGSVKKKCSRYYCLFIVWLILSICQAFFLSIYFLVSIWLSFWYLFIKLIEQEKIVIHEFLYFSAPTKHLSICVTLRSSTNVSDIEI